MSAPDTLTIVREMARVKALFQQRAVVTHLTGNPPHHSPDDLGEALGVGGGAIHAEFTASVSEGNHAR